MKYYLCQALVDIGDIKPRQMFLCNDEDFMVEKASSFDIEDEFDVLPDGLSYPFYPARQFEDVKKVVEGVVEKLMEDKKKEEEKVEEVAIPVEEIKVEDTVPVTPPVEVVDKEVVDKDVVSPSSPEEKPVVEQSAVDVVSVPDEVIFEQEAVDSASVDPVVMNLETDGERVLKDDVEKLKREDKE